MDLNWNLVHEYSLYYQVDAFLLCFVKQTEVLLLQHN